MTTYIYIYICDVLFYSTFVDSSFAMMMLVLLAGMSVLVGLSFRLPLSLPLRCCCICVWVVGQRVLCVYYTSHIHTFICFALACLVAIEVYMHSYVCVYLCIDFGSKH